MNALVETLAASPDLYPYALDVRREIVSFIRLSRSDYCRASFLDARILSPTDTVQTVRWPELAVAIDASGLAERCGFLFHIGHVGSTLLSRLIGNHPAVFSLREPLTLRTLAELRSDAGARPAGRDDVVQEEHVGGVLKLLSRTYEPGQIAVVKATSFVAELAAELLSRPAAPAAVMILVAPEPFLAGMLAGVNSRREAAAMAPGRLRRLQARVGRQRPVPPVQSEGESLAMAWACEVSALCHAPRERVLLMDFDRFLAAPQDQLPMALRRFGIDATAREVSAILDGPDLRRYSKAPEHAYDAALRREVLDESRASHATEIRRGLLWLQRSAAELPAIRDAVAFAATAAS
jgi:hypothetical protein